MFFNKWFKKKIIQPVTLIGEVISSYENIDIYKFKDVYSSDYSNISLLSIESSIIRYTDLIKNINLCLENDRLINQFTIPETIAEIYLSDFFMDDGCYIDTKLYIERFRDEAIIFLKNYESIEKNLEKSEIQNRNLVSISQVINNVIQIAGVLNYGKT